MREECSIATRGTQSGAWEGRFFSKNESASVPSRCYNVNASNKAASQAGLAIPSVIFVEDKAGEPFNRLFADFMIAAYSADRLVRLDPATGRITEIPLPIKDSAPYVARVDARGRVWIGTGAADALFRYDPATGTFETFRLPSQNAMVRHMAFDPRNGDLWLAYGASPGPAAKVARVQELK